MSARGNHPLDPRVCSPLTGDTGLVTRACFSLFAWDPAWVPLENPPWIINYLMMMFGFRSHQAGEWKKVSAKSKLFWWLPSLWTFHPKNGISGSNQQQAPFSTLWNYSDYPKNKQQQKILKFQWTTIRVRWPTIPIVQCMQQSQDHLGTKLIRVNLQAKTKEHNKTPKIRVWNP